ncbi:MAG: hypothetical protein AAGB04_15795 [Pseudomonadota bacterium]
MAKIVTVHGTFAHIEASPNGNDAVKQWWQPGSTFEISLKNMVEPDTAANAPGSDVEFKPFVWSGDNSERERRKAGSRLLRDLQSLEARNEKYCVVGHSHGGSVISSALLEAASRGLELKGLQKWITIGTPFVELRRERFLFLRLPLLLKAMFVASLMLLFMYLFYVVGELLDGQRMIENERQLIRLLISTALTAIPFVVFYLIALILDRRRLFFYRKSNQDKARAWFGDRWLPLSHEDDEAVRGLGSLRSMRMQIFSKTFAVPALSLMSVFILPLLYLYVLFSPTLMVSIADYLKTQVYAIDSYSGQEAGVKSMVDSIRQRTRQIRRARKRLDDVDIQAGQQLEEQSKIRNWRKERRDLRQQLNQRYPNASAIQRAQRFERRFLQERVNGQRRPCAGGKLCGGGGDVLLNAKLLFHLVTDEVASWTLEESAGRGFWGRLLRSAIPVLLVPLVFGLSAILLVLLVQFLAKIFSSVISRWLDSQTWFEIRRTALGNDTEAEVAVGTVPAPSWQRKSAGFLPAAVGEPIAIHSNQAMSQAIEKIRNSISEFALHEGSEGQIGSVLNYLTWQELIHTSYFEVPEFRVLLARAISESEGFEPSTAFRSRPDYNDVGAWLRTIEESVKQRERQS